MKVGLKTLGLLNKSGAVHVKNLHVTSATLTTISYTWDTLTKVDGYQFEVSNYADFSAILDTQLIVGAGTNTFTWAKIGIGDYYVRVRGYKD